VRVTGLEPASIRSIWRAVSLSAPARSALGIPQLFPTGMSPIAIDELLAYAARKQWLRVVDDRVSPGSVNPVPVMTTRIPNW
jgi:hypothetical protein